MFSTHPWTATRSLPTNPENHVRATPMKRKNFSVEEITLLKRLIQKYRPYQIESKKTDSVNLGEKQRIWENITKEFNTHFPYSDETSVKQLRKLWDNLKTRRKNELLRERLVSEEESLLGDVKRGSNYDLIPRDEVSDSLDSNPMSVDYSGLEESGYMNGNASSNWSLPIETVIVEDGDTYKEPPRENDEVELQKPFPSNNPIPEEKCQCSYSKKEVELRERKLRLILREEEELYKMKKDEQLLKNEIANVQLRIIKEKKTYLAKKRKLQLQILSKQLNTLDKPEVNGGDISESVGDEATANDVKIENDTEIDLGIEHKSAPLYNSVGMKSDSDV